MYSPNAFHENLRCVSLHCRVYNKPISLIIYLRGLKCSLHNAVNLQSRKIHRPHFFQRVGLHHTLLKTSTSFNPSSCGYKLKTCPTTNTRHLREILFSLMVRGGKTAVFKHFITKKIPPCISNQRGLPTDG
jgi:hypothetical protein